MVLVINGYFLYGYGMKVKGCGGILMVFFGDGFGGVNNLVIMVMLGDWFDLGLDVFDFECSVFCSGFGFGFDGFIYSGCMLFVIFEFGYNWMVCDNFVIGVSVFGNGGMNIDYFGGQFNCG